MRTPEFDEKKRIVIEMLSEKKCLVSELKQATGLSGKSINSMVNNLRRKYIVVCERAKKSTAFYYRITGDYENHKDDSNQMKKKFESTPFEDLPKDIFKGDLLTWYWRNPLFKVQSSTELVEEVKRRGLKVHEKNFRGEIYYI